MPIWLQFVLLGAVGVGALGALGCLFGGLSFLGSDAVDDDWEGWP